MSHRLQDSAASVFHAAPPATQWGVAGVSVVLAAVWDAFTGVLAAVMVLLFLCDLGLGVLRAINVGGLRAFCRDRFFQAFLKLGAAMFGILLASSIDLMLQHTGALPDATYVTSGILGAICVGFVASAGQNLAHFFPAVGSWFDGLVRRLRDPSDVPQRRASDENGGGS
jgi:hypothetical protein